MREVERAVNDTHEAACLLRRMLDRTVNLFGPGSKTTKDVPRWWESDAGYPVALHCAGDAAYYGQIGSVSIVRLGLLLRVVLPFAT